MVKAASQKALFTLSRIISIITLSVASCGVIDLSLYRPSVPENFIPGVLSQDLVSLWVAVGLLLCEWLIRRGRNLVWLIWAGLIGYLFYAYALYSFDGVYNPLYLFYLAIISLAIYALILFFTHADFRDIHLKTIQKPPPRKLTAVLFLFLALLFAGLWLRILIPAMRDRIPPDGNSIFVLDLSFVLPLLVVEARLLIKGTRLGDVLAIPLLIKAGTLGLSVFLGTLLAPWFDRQIDFASVGIYAVMGLGPLILIGPFLRSLSALPSKAV
ncbi:hypothetical protein S7335_134 [Synechococcus sp. PCC 7335]|uniref:hypothetical protein n=1 Tax=Synechococcus sp. (strain ATCC 29403 / PCC 7335) TaxID=91464 RepID=UPI00017EDD58|nr:hypothetical protein [Synechococcus sp. PCC 7335]EDX82956.1 hypothetical protein S7335_134 [Synechococcus sp. PCC 7335]